MNIQNKKNRSTARPAGIFFITAALSSVIGLKLYDPILSGDNFLTLSPGYYNQVIWAAINELILIVSAVGTGLMLYPYLKRFNEIFAAGYLSFRILEVVFILIGTLAMLTVLSISELYITGANTNEATANSLGLSFIALHKWTFILGPNFMLAINTFIYSYVFYRTKMIPINLARLGLTASLLIMVAAFLELFGIIQQISFWGIILALPIAIFEMSFASWLLWKGDMIVKENPTIS
ncbi:MAG TPA: DUF4386 domain-containing protein [Chryseobacterium sp.]|nr:DUF4386 domain-containing protein [Chryseobacterium sp.]